MTLVGRRTRQSAAALAAALCLLAWAPVARAEPDETTASIAPAEAAGADRSRAEYDRVSREITLSDERKAALAAEIDAVRKDAGSLTAALIRSAAAEKKLSQDIDAIAARLSELDGQAATIRASLAKRRDVLAEVLGALERMGLNPPPAILVRPEDALASVRSAILLGAVVPELRGQTEVLLADLGELARVKSSIEGERARLAGAFSDQLAEKQRLSLLIDEKAKVQASREAALAEEQRRSVELAQRATSLRELIDALDRQQSEARAAQAAAEEQRRREEAELAARPVPDANRLSDGAPFEALKGQLALPATGRVLRRFGEDDGNGGVMLGTMVATQSGAIVTVPADGHVLYAGPFRSYGQLLIVNAGGGYHVVLAGMSRINVALGQAVLAGEPVGAMGEARVASAAADPKIDTAAELYVEFRKDGKPVDPSPWWADRFSGRTGNGT